MANDSNLRTCIFLNNHLCITRPTIINLNPYKYNQELHYYPFMVILDVMNVLHDPSNGIFVPNKPEDVNLSVFNIITRINE